MSTKEDFPSKVEVVVLGTGVTESMVAASCARIGKSVLHLDRNNYYGGQWATFAFEALKQFFEKYQNTVGEVKVKQDSSNTAFSLPQFDTTIDNVTIKSYIPEKSPEEEIVDATASVDESTQKTCQSQIIEETEKLDSPSEINDNKKDIELLKTTDAVSEKNEEIDCDNKTDDCNFQSSNQSETISEEIASFITEKQHLKPAKQSPSLVSQAKIKDHENNVISIEDFLILSRKFNIDVSPKFLYSAGPLVKMILKANISHYAEFKVVDRILMWRDSMIVEVPCNRSDVFSSSFLSMIEKRTLMKFLTFCLESDENSEELKDDMTFEEFLSSKRLSENLQSFVIYSIAMVKPETEAKLAFIQTKAFISSLGQYGKTPFLWPLFGIGEIPQMFCRMSAVFAGLYCLKKMPSHITVDTVTKKCSYIVIDGQTVECDYLVMDPTYVPSCFATKNKQTMISKAILIVNKSLVISSEEHLSFLTIPPLAGKHQSVRVIEVGPEACACPAGLFVIYLSSPAVHDAFNDLNEYVSLLVDENIPKNVDSHSLKPKLFWAVYYNQTSTYDLTDDLSQNIHVGELPGNSLGFKHAIAKAEKIFSSLFPGEEFLVKVPNSEDIIWEYDENTDSTAVLNSEEIKVDSVSTIENDETTVDKSSLTIENSEVNIEKSKTIENSESIVENS